MRRFWADSRGIADGFAWLPAEDAAHALRVLRMGPGDPCELLHEGRRYAAEVDRAGAEGVRVRVLSPLPSTEARLRITLFQGLPKGEKLELIIQKAVELGAEAVVPVQMRRCVARVDARDAERKRERWQKIAREASKQSGRCVEMAVEAPCAWKALRERLADFDLILVPWEEERALSLRQAHEAQPDAVRAALLIGPEGGIDREEIAELISLGAKPVTLGPRILRTETAGLAAIAAMLCLWGDLEAPEASP